MIRSVPNAELKVNDVLALPMGRTAKITFVALGIHYVTLVTEEFGKTRLHRYEDSLVEIPPSMVQCYSDHNEDIRTKGSCDYCGDNEPQ